MWHFFENESDSLEVCWVAPGLLTDKQRWVSVKKPLVNEKFTDEVSKKE